MRRVQGGSISAREREAQAFAQHSLRRHRIRPLFPRLTGGPKRGQALFDGAVAEARRPHWFLEGAVPDSVEGRFAVLSTVLALFIVRLEQAGPRGESAAVALSERFIESMDAEIRQMGVSDPGLGRQVRSLVGALAARVERWRTATQDESQWSSAAVRSLYRDEAPRGEALAHSEAKLRGLWQRLEELGADDIAEGRLG